MAERWKFWIDVGGTFTDCLAVTPAGQPLKTKVLNRSDGRSSDLSPAPIRAIRELVGCGDAERSQSPPIPDCDVRLGTTRGTNALLTRSGAATAFVTTRGFRDLLHIGDQARPKLFELNICKKQPLFQTAIEINERILHDGTVEQEPNDDQVRGQLNELKSAGIESIAISLMHGFRFGQHERRVAAIARELGFVDVRTSHEVAPLIKIVPRSETTVLDAYLNPVISDYLDSIESCLSKDSTLQLMTSGGGLVPRSRFSGKDCVLSGPAGGVVAIAEIGKAFGFDQVIGFDMGGTSTDVSRVDVRSGGFEREYESTKAGVRVMTPMLAIETVAAGGGSICRYDGTKLVVGPQSAGADPGPACYGNDGPLTVTDVNFLLGRICADQFPFELDRAAAMLRIENVCRQLESSGSKLAWEQVAAGFLEIANHSMAGAIKSISVGKGYDPTEHALVSFGGAAAQHACAVADSLEMESIVDHPHASILSAVGIGAASPISHEVETVLQPLDGLSDGELEQRIERVGAKAKRNLGGGEGAMVRFVFDVRYEGTDARLSVSTSTASVVAIGEAFAEEHQRQFGYRKSVPVELMAVRAEAWIESESFTASAASEQNRAPESELSQPMYVDGAWIDAALYQREGLGFGDTVCGPAIITSRLSTTVVDSGWMAEVRSDSSLLLKREKPTGEHLRRVGFDEKAADPVRLEIFNQTFASIALRMGVTLQKTSVSVNVKERLDFSCAIFTGGGDLVVNAPHIPVHLGAMSETVRHTIAANARIVRGDVFVTNNPYAGGSHLPDVTVLCPVFLPDDEAPSFWVASRSHHSEIGGKAPGSMPPDARTLGEEGVLIDNFRLIDGDGDVARYAELRDVLKDGTWPSRAPQQNLDDIAAQVAANRVGEQELLALAKARGGENVLAYMGFIQQAARAKALEAIARIPGRERVFEDCLDNGATIRLKLTRSGESLKLDFTGTDATLEGNLNANRAIVSSAILYVMRLLIGEEIPLNEGVIAPVDLVLPECFLNPAAAADPRLSPAVVGGNVETSQRVVDVLLGALGLAAASQGTMNNWLMGDDTFGYYETLGGGSGATASASGADAVHVHMTNTRLTDPEVFETRFPVVLRESSVRRGSGGAGRHRGGDGMVRDIEFRKQLLISLLTNRRSVRPWGAAGGSDGQSGCNTLIRAGEAVSLDHECQFPVRAGDRLRIETPGGGGFG